MKISIYMVCAFILMSCSTPSKKIKSNKVSSQTQTRASSKNSFQLRAFQEVQLENGLKIIFIEDKSLPRVSLQLLVKVGALQDPQNLIGLNYLTANLLDQGTNLRTSPQLAEDIDQMGTAFSASASHDFTLFSMDALTQDRSHMIQTFYEILTVPSFNENEIRRLKGQMLAQIQKRQDDPSSFVEDKFDTLIFKDHPFAKAAYGEPASINKIQKTDLLRHFLKFYRPNNATLAVAGDLDSEFQEELVQLFAGWSSRDLVPTELPAISEEKGFRVELVSKPGLNQTQIRMGHVGISRDDPNYLALRAANLILGGAFASRLNQRVRDDLGLTYSISSSFDAKTLPGAWTVSTFTRHEKVEETVRETLAVLKTFQTEGIRQEELDAAKALLKGQFPLAIETVDRLAFNLLALRYYGVPDSYLSDFNKLTDRLNVKEINQLIQSNFRTEDMKIMIYSDAKKVKDQVALIKAP